MPVLLVQSCNGNDILYCVYVFIAPSAPQGVATLTSPSGAVIVSWLPPNPRNGIILQYLIQVSLASTNQTVNSQTVSVGNSMAEQEIGRSVTFVGLDLDNFQYRIEVYASTSVGTGPSSIPVFIGMDSGNLTPPMTSDADATTTEAPPTSTTIEQPQDTTSSSVQMTSSPATDITSLPDGTSTNPLTSEPTTDMLETAGDTAPAPVRDEEYYIVRIVPPVVIGLFILVIVVVVLMGCCCRSRTNRESKKKGLYTVYPPGDYALR